MAYTTVGYLRSRIGSCSVGYSDPELQSLINLFTNFIDMVTGWWFEPRAMVFDLDGRGTEILQLPVPICTVTKVELLDQSYEPAAEELDLDSVVIYNRHLTQRLINPDDRKNPKLALVSSGVGPSPIVVSQWPHGFQNTRITGVFGFTEFDSTSERTVLTNVLDTITAPDAIHMETGAFTQEDVGKTMTIAGSASNDGAYVVATVVDSKNVTVSEQTLTTEGSGFTATMSAAPQWGITPLAIRDVCERLCIRDLPSAPGTGQGGPQDPAWYEQWMRSRGRVTQEKVRDQSISYAALGTGGSGGNDAGVITGDPMIDLILLMHSRPTTMRAV